MPVRIENDSCYIIRGDGQRAAVEMNLERIPGFDGESSIVTGTVLNRLLGDGWQVRETRATPYDGLIEAVMARVGEAAPVFETLDEEDEVEKAARAVEAEALKRAKEAKAKEAEAKTKAETGPKVVFINARADKVITNKHAEVIRKVLLPALKKDVVVYDAGVRVEPQPGKFVIVFNRETPLTDYPPCANKCCFVQPKTMWGVSVENMVEASNNTMIVPWLDGVPVFTSEGAEVAAVRGDELYVYWNATGTGNENMLKVVEKLYETALDAREHPEKYVRETGLESYKKLCAGRLLRETEATEKAAYSAEQKIKELRKLLIEKQTEFMLLERQLQQLNSANSDDKTKYETEFKTLSERFDDVTEVRVIGTAVYVTTKEITCVDPRSNVEHLLGRFRFVIDFGTMRVRIFNLDRIVAGYDSGMQAPHVFTYGRPCWGTMETTIADLMMRMDVPALVQVILAYLRSVNTDDSAGRHISEWPVKGSGKRPAGEKAPNVRTITHAQM